MKYLLVLFLSLLLVGCASSPRVVTKEKLLVYVPERIATPSTPKIEQYDTRYGLDHPINFRRFQQNQLLMSDYIITLRETIKYYEEQVDQLTTMKEQAEADGK